MPEEIKIKVSADTDQAQRNIDRLNKSVADTGKSTVPTAQAKPVETTAPKGFVPTIKVDGNVLKHGTTAEAEAKEKQKQGPAKHSATSTNSGSVSSMAAENTSAANFMAKAEAEEAAAKSAAKSAIAEDLAAKAAAVKAKETKAAAADEKKAAEETAKNAIFNGKARQELVTAARMTAEGQSPMRALGSAAGQILPAIGNTISAALGVSLGALAGIASGIAAAGAVVIAGINSNDASNQEDKSAANRIRAERGHDRRHQNIARSWRGSAEGSTSEAFEARQRSADLGDQEPELEHDKRLSIWNPMRLLGGGRADGTKTLFGHKTAAQRAIDKNKEDQKRANQEAESSEKSAREQWMTEGEIELNVKRDTALHSLAGMKAKRIDLAKLSWEKEFKRVLAETNENNGLATESANLKVGEEQRQIGLQQAAGLVNARSGAGDIAQAAKIANMSGMGSEGWQAIKDLHTMIDDHSQKAAQDRKFKIHSGALEG